MEPIKITKPTVSDIPALINLWRGQYEYHHAIDPVYYVAYSDELGARFAEYLRRAIETDTPQILVAKESEAIIGFITFTKESDDYMDTQIREFGLVIELFVSESARGKGIGKLLMEQAESYFASEGLSDMKLYCSTLNTGTMHFYERLGYMNRQTAFFKRIRVSSQDSK